MTDRVTILVALLAVLVSAPAAAETASLPDIEDEVMCPICGTTLELSNAPQAERERELIRRLIDQGKSKDEIKEVLVAEYGEEVLAVPEDSGFDLTAWVLPVIGILLAAIAVGLALRRWRRRARRYPEHRNQLDAEEAARLEKDLSRYDL